MKKNFPIVACIAELPAHAIFKSVCTLLCFGVSMFLPLSTEASTAKVHFLSLFGINGDSGLTEVGYLESGIVPDIRFLEESSFEVNRLALIPLMEVDTVFSAEPLEMEEIITDEVEAIEEAESSVTEITEEAPKEELSPQDILMLFKKQIKDKDQQESDVSFVLPTDGSTVDPGAVKRVKSRYSIEP